MSPARFLLLLVTLVFLSGCSSSNRQAPPPGDPPPSVPANPAPLACPPLREPECAGAYGTCPEWRCVDGAWKDVRPALPPSGTTAPPATTATAPPPPPKDSTAPAPPPPSVVAANDTPRSTPASPAKPCPPQQFPSCGGAVGFCPEWRCIDGKWIDVRNHPGLSERGPAPDQEFVAKLRLVARPAEVDAGDKLDLFLENVDAFAHAYHFPGGSNGCEDFRWAITFTSHAGRFANRPPRKAGEACTSAMIPPRWIRIPPGENVKLPIDTGSRWFRLPGGEGPVPLPAGTYQVVVQGANATARTSMSIR